MFDTHPVVRGVGGAWRARVQGSAINTRLAGEGVEQVVDRAFERLLERRTRVGWHRFDAGGYRVAYKRRLNDAIGEIIKELADVGLQIGR